MTETRKQIIELISDFMDKTLSEGCLIKKGGCNYLVVKTDGFGYVEIFNLDLINKPNSFLFSSDKYEIIGHYDITAVLKYSGKCEDCKYIDIEIDDFALGIKKKDRTDYVRIPKKPLHLYTEDEDKQLLDLLEKIKND